MQFHQESESTETAMLSSMVAISESGAKKQGKILCWGFCNRSDNKAMKCDAKMWD